MDFHVKIASACFGVYLLSWAAVASAITIDQFNGDMHLEVDPATPLSSGALAISSAIGGQRTVKLGLTNPAGHGRAQVYVDYWGPDTQVSYAEDYSGAGWADFDYDGNATPGIDDFDGLGGVDLTRDGATSFVVGVWFFDLPFNRPTALSVTVWDASVSNGSRWSKWLIFLNERFSAPPIKFFSVPFSSPSLTGPDGAADLQKAGAIKFRIEDDSLGGRDLGVSVLQTNGVCTHVPVGGVIMNSCGVCGVADADVDGDGAPDCQDLCPTDPDKIAPGVCGCGVPEQGSGSCQDLCPSDPNKTAPGICGCCVADTDTDHDGTADCLDQCPNDPSKTTPGTCGCGVADTDTDVDGTPDCRDLCPNNPLAIDPGVCGCDMPDQDYDGDGVLDCLDQCPHDPNKTAPGTCGCGTPEQPGGCDDLCPNDPNKAAPGVCGCGVPDIDTDKDGTPDCTDLCPSEPGLTQPGACGCSADVNSCIGCDGVPNSGKVFDRCGVCDGDGQSYLGCKTVDHTAVIKTSQDALLTQIRWARKLGRQGERRGITCPAQQKKTEKIYKQAGAVVTTYPATTTECANISYCTNQNMSVNTSEYDELARQLMKATQALVACLADKDNPSGGICKGSAAECQAKARERIREQQKLTRHTKQLYKASVKTSADIPQSSALCCDEIK